MQQTVVAITRMGFGVIYDFPSRLAADDHPLVQYGDPILAGPRDLVANYRPNEFPVLFTLCGRPELGDEFIAQYDKLPTDHQKRAFVEQYAEPLWELVVSTRQTVPADPEQIVALVKEDRKSTRLNPPITLKGLTMAKRSKAAEAEVENQVEGEATEKAPRGPRINRDRKITLLSDAEGKQYGADHNPKRAGSASAARFACYVDGMTVGEALDAGITTADLAWDQKAGFIEVSADE